MRRAARVDANQDAIVEALRAAGASVYVIGKPVDLLVGYGNQNFVLECKDGRKTAGNRPLTKDQKDWMAEWKGSFHVVLSPEDALRAIGATA